MSVASSRTNGFLFADLRDYTKYVESHGDRAAATLLDAYRILVRSAVAEFDGAEIKTEGDSFYVVFPSASSAVQCGLAILAAAESADRAGPSIRVGIGVHAGETVETAEGYVGSAVNVAARVCSQAKAGELLVTDTVRALTRTHLPVRFVERRVRRLKGITEPVVMYRAESAAETVVGAPSAVPVLRRRGPLAVILVGLLIGSAAAGYVLVAAQRPAATPLVTPSASPAPASFPNSVEADLLDQVPATVVRDGCARDDDDALARATANLRCDLELSAEADTVWYHRFDTAQAMADYLAGVQQTQHLQFGTCAPGVSRAQGSWQVGGTHSGSAYCYQADGSSWIIWSYTAERILARAVRSGDSTADWQGLYEWWTQIRLFLR